MRQRLVAVVVVVTSACAALHYSSTSQNAVAISNNPYHFSSGGSASFVVSPQGSGDHDILQDIQLSLGCSSQWTLYTNVDSQPLMGAHVCSGVGSGTAFATVDNSDAITCPRNYQFLVGFAGTQAGVSTCNVNIFSMDYYTSAGNVYTLVLTGSGSAQTGILVSPEDINFGDVQIGGTSSVVPVDVKNLGTSSVTINTSLSGQGFQVTPSSNTVGAGSSASFDVTCHPIAVGGLSGTLSFSSTSGSGGSTTLRCNGIDSNVDLNPQQVNFGNTLVGRPPMNKTIQITGDGSAYIEYVTLDSDATTNGVTIVSNPQMMSVGSGQAIVLAYDAAAMHPAGTLGTLAVKFDVDEKPRNVVISGQALLGGLGTNPASVELGAVCAGSTATKDVEVYASEAGDIQLQNLTKPAAPFDAMMVDTLPKQLGGNHTGTSATVRVTLAPTEPGDYTDAIGLTSDVPNKEMSEVTLHGIGLAAGIAATPNVVHFGTTAPGTTTSIKEVQLTNCGTTDLSFDRATITGAQATEFTLIGANPARVLKPTEAEVFMIVMQPETGGYKTAQLVIEHSAGTTPVDLDGTGDGDGNGGKDRETYYACSTGRGAALWPIALALVLVLLSRRRRR